MQAQMPVKCRDRVLQIEHDPAFSRRIGEIHTGRSPHGTAPRGATRARPTAVSAVDF
jgi:hypothetical protein